MARPPSDWLALLVLAGVVALLAAGYLIFPPVQHWVWRQQCIASGRITGC